MQDIRITIAIPSNGLIHTRTVSSLIGGLAGLECEKDLFFPLSNAIPFNRNSAVERAKQTASTHLMFVDADMAFPQDGIQKLLAANKMIIGADYSYRQLPPRSTVKFLGKDGDIINATSSTLPAEPFQCYAVATGFMLINMQVFESMSRPYFQFVETMSDFSEYMTEDVYFCNKANEAGIEVWCDPTIKMGHIGEYVYEVMPPQPTNNEAVGE